MPNLIILVFVGGAFGAMCREFIMLSVPRLADGFPMDIFVANIIAAFLLGLATSLFKKDIINQYVHLMVGTGIMGAFHILQLCIWCCGNDEKPDGRIGFNLLFGDKPYCRFYCGRAGLNGRAKREAQRSTSRR